MSDDGERNVVEVRGDGGAWIDLAGVTPRGLDAERLFAHLLTVGYFVPEADEAAASFRWRGRLYGPSRAGLAMLLAGAPTGPIPPQLRRLDWPDAA